MEDYTFSSININKEHYHLGNDFAVTNVGSRLPNLELSVNNFGKSTRWHRYL